MKRLAPVVVALLTVAVSMPAAAQVPGYVSAPPQVTSAPETGPYIDPAFVAEKTMTGVVYGRNADWKGAQQDLILDLWEPEGNDDQFRPAIVWAAGNISHSAGTGSVRWMPEMVRRGYVVVSIDYRRQPDALGAGDGFIGVVGSVVERGPEALDSFQNTLDSYRNAQHDMQSAVRWLRANAADLRIDPNQIIAAGHSAGAVTTLRAAFNAEDPGESGNTGWPSHVAAAMSLAGTYAAPATGDVIRPGDPPIVVFQGTNDPETPVFLGLAPCLNTLATANVCEAHVYPGAGHTPGDSASNTREAVDFLYRHVIDARRVRTTLSGIKASAKGEAATVTGRLITESDEPLADARILGRTVSGAQAETITGPDGSFLLTIGAEDHGRSLDVLLRYEGHSTGSWLDDPQIAPTHAVATVTWGQAGADAGGASS